MRVAILFTGGVESTALIEHALKENITFDLIHIVHNNRSGAENVFCKQIAKYYDKELFEVSIRKDRFDEQYSRSYRDIVAWLPIAMMATVKGKYNQVWFGNHKGEMDHTDSWSMFDAWNIMVKLRGINDSTKLKSPLMELTKVQQYSIIPPIVKKMIVGCEHLTVDEENNPVFCGYCGKCREWKKYNIVRDA